MSEQLTIPEPKVTHAWVTFYEDAGERRQRKVECLRSERGLAITYTRTDSDRYAELRRLVEAVQIDSQLGTARAALDALLDWRHQ